VKAETSLRPLPPLPTVKECVKPRLVVLPTVALLVLCYLLFASGCFIFFFFEAFFFKLSAFFLNSLAIYLSFTPLHEAAHGNVSRISFLNAAVGRLSAVFFHGFFPTFRHVHLRHHRYTNDAERDPDHWSLRSPILLRWLSLDLSYFRFVPATCRENSALISCEMFFLVLLFIAFTGLMLWMGFGLPLLILWLLPVRLATFLLGFGFDWLPHHSHNPNEPRSLFSGTVARPGKILNVLLLCQNLHNVHHVYPAVPFHLYPKVWKAGRKWFEAKGTKIF
jgi:beta-carotene hydroxylase